MAHLLVASIDQQLALHIDRMDGETWALSMSLVVRPGRETKLQIIFTGLGLAVPASSDVPVPNTFIENQPVEVMYQISPRPSDAKGMADLVSVIFQQFCGMTTSSPVHVHEWEISKIA